MKTRELFSGAPILPGRWSALICLWIAGFLAGDVDINMVKTLLGVNTNPDHNWVVNAVQLFIGFGFLVTGILQLDRYGRNCWFAFAPDDVQWAGLTRADIKRRQPNRK